MCDCLSVVNEELKQYNTEIGTGFGVSGDLGKMSLMIMISTVKLDSNERGKPRSVSATFCPFCGTKYKSGEV